MTVLSILLLITGAVLVCVEVFIPGFGLCGAAGMVLMVISAIITIVYLPMGIFIVLAEAMVLAAVFAVIFNYIRKKQLYGKIILDETLASEADDIGDLDYFFGKSGVSKTPLRPFGEAEFNGVRVEVVSEGGYIPENRSVTVTSVENRRITVKAVQ